MSEWAEHDFSTEEHQHQRYNPLTGNWVLVSPQRLQRPWMGQTEEPEPENIPPFDPTNPLCPGVQRPSGEITPEYNNTYVFNNDYPCLLEEAPTPQSDPEDPLFQVKAARGVCRVMCYHPQSNMSLPLLPHENIVEIINQWVAQCDELGQKYTWVQIFENKGSMMGCSNMHPHCQIWASDFLPNEARNNNNQMMMYRDDHHGANMIMDYVAREMQNKIRIICENADWVVVVPFWAAWPFETMILPKKHILRFTDVTPEKRETLAQVMKILLIKYDNLFKCAFPYTMGWHGAPTGRYKYIDMNHWCFHGLFYPPLLRSATVKKFMVGYELLAQVQRDMTPEKAAHMLREQPNIHYTLTNN